MRDIYRCPHCGEISFNPWTKATAGQLNSKGRVCQKCGRRCVNGREATIFKAVYSVIAFILIVITYLNAPKTAGTAYEWIDIFEVEIVIGLILSISLIPKLVNAFFFKMAPAIRIEPKK